MAEANSQCLVYLKHWQPVRIWARPGPEKTVLRALSNKHVCDHTTEAVVAVRCEGVTPRLFASWELLCPSRKTLRKLFRTRETA
jgi:hypothetical protein